MEHFYIKFNSPTSDNLKTISKATSIFRKLITGVASTLIPKANPDFDPLIDNVSEWMLEINMDDKKPNREIGIDQEGKTIIIMPWGGNYGYWSDNDITLDYFIAHFKAVEVEKINFETKWNEFIKQGSFPESYEFDKRGFSKYYRYLEQLGWKYDGAMTFKKGNEIILFDTSEYFYIQKLGDETRKEFQCKNIVHFADVLESNTTK